MTDLASIFAQTAAEISLSEDAEFPTFPTKAPVCGNSQVSVKKEISHVSHISHAQEWDHETKVSEFARSKHRCDAHAQAREVCAEPVGNVGNVGNYNPGRGLHFPHPSIKVGNVGNALAADSQTLPAIDGLILWRAALARTNNEHPPCPGYRSGEWPIVLARALAFLDTFGEQAEALGWTAPRLFGVHPTAGVIRVDACGALMLAVGCPIRAITADTISLGHLVHREKPGQPKGEPVWEFGR